MDCKICIVINLFSLLFMSVPVRSFLSDIEKASSRLDELLVGVETGKYSGRNSEGHIELWQDYEFGTGVGNRDELVITNITTRIDPELSGSINNYQFVDSEGEFFLAGSTDHVFSLYKLNLNEGRTIYRTDVNLTRKIRNFKLFRVPNSSQSVSEVDTNIFAILCVEFQNGTELMWYRFTGEELVFFESWPVQNAVESLEYFHYEGQNRLLILREVTSYFGQLFSPVDIYGFSIVDERPNLWLSQRQTIPKSFDLHVCPTYESTIIALRRENDVVIYDYKGDHNKEGLFRESQIITSNNLRNLVCFESGYIRYLVTSGPEAALFDFFENEFQHDSYSEHIFNEIGEISWIQSIPVDNYREESILLVQLKNLTIMALSWKGRGFERISLPDLKLNHLDLSHITVIPKYGFVYGNKLVKIETRLREKARPVRDEMEKLLQTRSALAEVLRKQELILDETEIRINKSYFVNPEVTGVWNLTEITVKSVKIEEGVSNDEVSIGKKKMTLEEFLSDQDETKNILKDLESKLEEIKVNLANGVPIDSSEVTLIDNLFIEGSFDVRGTMSVADLTFDYFNGLSREEIIKDFTNYDDTLIIEGQKIFESIDVANLIVGFINGVPINDIKFDKRRHDYSKIDFSKLTKLKIEGDLNFTRINGIDWEKLMKKVVLKSQSKNITGVTIVEGDLVADNIQIERLNGLRYPEDYILTNSPDTVEMTGKKKFEKLTVEELDLDEIKTINGVSIDEYVTLKDDRSLKEEITFDNLIITESFYIDGTVTGLSDDQKLAGLMLNETANVIADVVFMNLTVIGDVEIENSLNGTMWSKLDDLVSLEDEMVEIMGEKIFLNEIEVDSELVIENQKINGRSIDEFVTLDTDQEFPNLEKISGNVKFDHVTRGDLESLKKLLTEDLDDEGHPKCMSKTVVFKVPPTVDRLFLDTINGNISATEFSQALNKTFSNVHFQNLKITNLHGRKILPITVNGKNFEKLKRVRISKTKPQVLTGDYEIDILETNLLTIDSINGIETVELENLRNRIDDIYDGIINGSVTIDTLRVEGKVGVETINGESIRNIYNPDTMGTLIFEKDVFVENLIVEGLMNGINFTEFMEDAVLKTDTDIVMTGKKIFDKIICESLEASSLNGKSVDYILDPDKHQVLMGSIKVNGTVTVLDQFDTEANIGGIPWKMIRDRIQFMGNNTYALNGDVVFTSEEVEIANLVLTDSIQGVNFDDFLESIVYKNSTNVTIYTPVVFKAPVTIDAPFMITETFNDLDLKYFYDHAVRIDQPFNIKSQIIFTENIVIEEDLIVDEELDAKMIGGVDLKELYESAVFVDRPTSIPGTVILNNVIFESDIEVETLNDIDLGSVITLEGEQTFDGTLHCMDITVGKLDIDGTVNGYDLDAIYTDTIMLTGNQNISRHIIFTGNVRVHHDFDANLINGIDPSKMISLDGNETLIGNFIFEHPLVLHGNVNTNGPINDIDLMKWQATSVTKSFPIKQIVKGAWTIHGNVHFEKDIYGNDFLNGVNVTKLANDMHKRDLEMKLIMEDVKKDQQSFCADLSVLKISAENQIYKFKFFDYLQVLNFDRTIVSVHHFESEDFDYLLVNFDNCHLDIFVFNGMEFTAVTSLSNVGYIDSWLTLHFEEQIYFLTVGKYACDKNSGNLWKLDDDQFVHVYDLGNVTDAKIMNENEFLIIVDGIMIRRSIVEIIQRSLSSPRSYKIGSENPKFVADSSEVLLVNRETIYEYKFKNGTESRQLTNRFGTNEISSFRTGIYEREIFIYHDENLSEEYVFISDDNYEHPKILQTITTQRPSSIIMLNFDGLVENFLIFVENQRIIQIYEYRGIEGFVYRESIRMEARKIFKFKVRKYVNLVKKHCIAAIQDKRLVIMEAKMYGERLDMGSLPCEN